MHKREEERLSCKSGRERERQTCVLERVVCTQEIVKERGMHAQG